MLLRSLLMKEKKRSQSSLLLEHDFNLQTLAREVCQSLH